MRSWLSKSCQGLLQFFKIHGTSLLKILPTNKLNNKYDLHGLISENSSPIKNILCSPFLVFNKVIHIPVEDQPDHKLINELVWFTRFRMPDPCLALRVDITLKLGKLFLSVLVCYLRVF